MKRKVLYLLQCVVMIVLSACSEDDLQSLQAAFESNVQEVTMGESVTFKDASIIYALPTDSNRQCKNRHTVKYKKGRPLAGQPQLL